jgi:hypothetical protein
MRSYVVFCMKEFFEKVAPYPYTVAEFTEKIYTLRNYLGHTIIVDKGLSFQFDMGAEGKVAI